MPQVNNLENPTKVVQPGGEVGGKEDLGKNLTYKFWHHGSEKNVDPELTRDFQPVEEKLDYQAKEKSVADIQADIQRFREQIKLGETKDANGNYNEKLILENEAKLRAAEQTLADIKEKANNEILIASLRKEIQSYRENIKTGETKNEVGRYDEKLVLENEARLKAAEEKIATLSKARDSSMSNQTYSSVKQEASSLETPNSKAPAKKKGFFSRLFSFGQKQKI